jgi:hypothetical protein
MYNAHRGMGPPGQAPPGTRLAELLEQVRAEFETQAGRSNEHEHQRKHSTDHTGAVDWWHGAARTRAFGRNNNTSCAERVDVCSILPLDRHCT